MQQMTITEFAKNRNSSTQAIYNKIYRMGSPITGTIIEGVTFKKIGNTYILNVAEKIIPKKAK